LTTLSPLAAYPVIRKTPGKFAPNLADYEFMRSEFTWEDARRELSYLPGGQGLNIAHSSGALLTRAGSPVRLTVSSRR